MIRPMIVRWTLAWADRIVLATACSLCYPTVNDTPAYMTTALIQRTNMNQGGLLAILVVLPVVWGNGGGPPTNSQPGLCETMVPGHGKSTAPYGEAPYEIKLSTEYYKKGETIDVTLDSKVQDKFFRGFFIQARRKDAPTTSAIGSFISEPEDGSQFIQCGTLNSAWGHSHRNKKTSVTATWLGPATDIGVLVFKATVVGYNRTEYWTGLLSPDITFGNANGMQSSSLMVLLVMAVASYAAARM